MQDLISRQTAIREIIREANADGSYGYMDAKELVDLINRLPSAQSELQTAIQEILDYLDNVLHPLISPDNWNVYNDLYDMVEQLSFCPNCGADMREENNGRPYKQTGSFGFM